MAVAIPVMVSSSLVFVTCASAVLLFGIWLRCSR
jgi:hypothetical protein